MTANKATPEELVEFLRKVDSRQQSLTSATPPYSKFGEAADLIESQRNAVIEELVKRQAEDDGLWFNAKYATEAYLQDALRQLHKAVEDLKNDSAVPVKRQCES